jgi:glycosyltransferase involved in cell wall biosynthesis
MAPHVLLVGPLPPPSGGMANQTRQLAQLLRQEGLRVDIVQTNAPYSPQWLGGIWGLRAFARLLPYLWRLWRMASRADIVHVMANSGIAWYLFAAPAIHIARLRGKPAVVNYRGGLAESFLAGSHRSVLASLQKAQRVIVPSGFLQAVFARYGVNAHIIPNIVNVDLFAPSAAAQTKSTPHVVIARNLESIYGIDVALRAVALLIKTHPRLRVSIAGSGPELQNLQRLAQELQVSDNVTFTGRLEVAAMAELYRSADLVLNPTRVDNTPNSILEALACGVPVVSTDVGGIPFLVRHGQEAWLLPPDDPSKMAEGVEAVLRDGVLCQRFRAAGLELARACSWPVVKQEWLNTYRQLVST